MNVLFLNLPDPPRMYVGRDYCGGFGSGFRARKGDRHAVFPIDNLSSWTRKLAKCCRCSESHT